MIMILRTTLISIFFKQAQIIGFCVICLLSLTSCVEWLPEAHRLDINEGNTVKLEQVEALQIGMNKNQVRKIMGEPMLADPFHQDRWDYIYRFIPTKGFERKSLLTLYFKDEQLDKIDDSKYIEP
jgi:outer membrane protein assembly factor BamE